MAIIDIGKGDLSARISTAGGLVLGLWWDRDGASVPLLRPAPGDDADALASGCYPLVPFGNRVRGNAFRFEGRDYRFQPNTDWDPHYLHGEGWQADWSVLQHGADAVTLSFAHLSGEGTPYRYEAQQRFAVNDGAFVLGLSVTNRGDAALPFGLGWHPYFPMTPETTLLAPATRYWTEVEGWLPGEAVDIPEDVDFRSPRSLPHHWVNNGFEDWSGEARIDWPERATRLSLSADPLFRHAFVFVSDTGFDPAFQRDYFCLEPMSHLADGQNMPGLGDLKVLRPGETLSGSVRLTPARLA
ncbi:aldose 1-epimerase [Shinella oryzae]|uniref:Aldose 1-epimerase n=1 Tax=Shinella oryzae TaxID=2871820 RepID=A0ABY9KC12_9HYPH|nr:aldose 1-epimerase [Shinella oryzae]WLS05514.1 aldose 1-epimerase [Shinella oryzae]